MGTSTRDLLGGTIGGVTFVSSLVVMGFSASIIAHDHDSKIGITHLVVSLVSLLLIVGWIGVVSADTDDGASCAVFLVVVTTVMYLAAVIALAVDPTSRPDYLKGQRQLLHKNDSSVPFAQHPYYGLFFFDILTIVLSILCLVGTGCL